MSVVRRFVVAPSLVRLIRKERGSSRVSEGYFAPQGGRTSLVRIDGQTCHLILISAGADGASSEERTEVPRAHGEALLDVCSGKAAYDRTALSHNGREILIDRYVTPAGLDLASVTFDDENASKSFPVPAWLGAEVSADGAYDRQAVALQGVPAKAETALSNAALDAVLDLLEPRFGLSRPTSPPAPAPSAPRPVAVDPAPAAPSGQPVGGAAAKPTNDEVSAPSKTDDTGSGSLAAVSPPALSATPLAAPTAAAPEPVKPVPESERMNAVSDNDPDGAGGDSRIDDVIESLSQALGAAIQQPREPAKDDEIATSFERWTVRPRRTQQ